MSQRSENGYKLRGFARAPCLRRRSSYREEVPGGAASENWERVLCRVVSRHVVTFWQV